MRRFLLALVFYCAVGSAGAVPVTIDLQDVRLVDYVRLVYGEIMKRSYVFESSFLDNKDLLSVSFYRLEPVAVEAETRALIAAHGFAAIVANGVAVVSKMSEAGGADEVLVYHPRHRPVSYLLDAVETLFKPGSFMGQRAMSSVNIAQVAGTVGQGVTSQNADQGVSSLANRDSDVLVFRGSAKDTGRLNGLLAQLDTATPEIMVEAVVFEVQTGEQSSSGVDLAFSVLRGKLGLNVATGAAAASSATLKVIGSGVDLAAAIFSLASDNRFKVVSSPRVRVLSGGVARFSVGNETPVLDAVTFDQQGRPIQSVSYKPSGVIFELRPKVREGGSELAIMQQISQFVTTTTGVNNTPTLIKRELSTLVAAKDDEIILVGGLDEQRTTNNESGLTFLPSFLRHSSHDGQNTEIVLLLHVQRI